MRAWRDLPPVGQRVRSAAPGDGMPDFPGWRALYLQSGTAALALALRLAAARRPEVSRPRVILPGYGCPDLLAAALHAGLEPLLVDIGATDPGYDLDALDACLRSESAGDDGNSSIVAVVAVNFMGIRERLAELRMRASQLDAWLVEDNAQWFPEGGEGGEGDAMVLSFGRGKPVNLLGGGALLLNSVSAGGSDEDARASLQPAKRDPLFPLRRRLLNSLLHPRLYPLLSRNPLLSIGETRFKSLSALVEMGPQRQASLGSNARAWLAQPRWREQALSRGMEPLAPELLDLPRLSAARAGRLLRYPLLCRNRAHRDELLQALCQQGLGATAMYRQPLPEVAGVAAAWPASVAARERLPGAAELASRLLTLPLHAGVRERDIERMLAVLKAGNRG